jgi:hypothetical protein
VALPSSARGTKSEFAAADGSATNRCWTINEGKQQSSVWLGGIYAASKNRKDNGHPLGIRAASPTPRDPTTRHWQSVTPEACNAILQTRITACVQDESVQPGVTFWRPTYPFVHSFTHFKLINPRKLTYHYRLWPWYNRLQATEHSVRVKWGVAVLIVEYK